MHESSNQHHGLGRSKRPIVMRWHSSRDSKRILHEKKQTVLSENTVLGCGSLQTRWSQSDAYRRSKVSLLFKKVRLIIDGHVTPP